MLKSSILELAPDTRRDELERLVEPYGAKVEIRVMTGQWPSDRVGVTCISHLRLTSHRLWFRRIRKLKSTYGNQIYISLCSLNQVFRTPKTQSAISTESSSSVLRKPALRLLTDDT